MSALLTRAVGQRLPGRPSGRGGVVGPEQYWVSWAEAVVTWAGAALQGDRVVSGRKTGMGWGGGYGLAA